MQSTALEDLDCAAIDQVLTFCATEADLDALSVPRCSKGWVNSAVLARNWLHRAIHEDEAIARKLSDRLDLRWADWVASVRDAGPRSLAGSLKRASACPPHAGLLWSLLTDPRPQVRTQGALLGRTWTLRACGSDHVARADPSPARRNAG